MLIFIIINAVLAIFGFICFEVAVKTNKEKVAKTCYILVSIVFFVILIYTIIFFNTNFEYLPYRGFYK